MTTASVAPLSRGSGHDPVITTGRLVLRPPAATDAEAFIAFYATRRSEYVGGPKDRPEAWGGFARLLGHWQLRGYGLFAVTVRGDARDRAVAMIGPWYPEGWAEREIGWLVLDPDAEGQGYAHEAALAARAHAYGVLRWPGAVSYIAPGNARSIRLAERLGAVCDADAEHHFDDPALVFRHPSPTECAS